METANMQAQAQVMPEQAHVEPTEPVQHRHLVAVEIMNGVVFAVVLILFGFLWATIANVTFGFSG